MKMMKRFLILTLSILMTFCFGVLFASAADAVSEFAVTTAIAGKDVRVEAYLDGKNIHLFLPYDADISNLKVDLESSYSVSFNGKQLKDGDTLSLTAGETYRLVCGYNNYTLSVFKGSNIPAMYITTESGSMDAVHADKGHKEKADIVIMQKGKVILEDELEYIKGRGNSTWALDKKPYNIKFDSKTDLFSMGKAKKWSLLANHVDESLIRNDIALDLAEAVGLEYTSKHTFVDLFINEEYFGNYLLTESVEVGENRVDIADLEGDTEDVNENDLDSYPLGGAQEEDYYKLEAGTQKWVNIPNNPDDITGGYLLEYDLPNRYVNEISGFVTDRNQTIVLKAPEYASEAQVKYVSALYQEFEDAVFSETGYNSLGKHYSEYIDMESFVKMYVFQEYIKNLDAGLTSFYLYKDTDSDLFFAAPVWDFDYSLGKSFRVYGTNLQYASGWWAGVVYYRTDNAAHYLPTILNALFRHKDFFDAAATEWNTVFLPKLHPDYYIGIYDFATSLSNSAVMNAVRWNTFSTSDYTETKKEYSNHISSVLLMFMQQRKQFLTKGFADGAVRVFFDANGGTGGMFNDTALKAGDSYVIPVCSFENGDLVCDTWNTAKDGSGTSYSEGDTLPLGEEDVTLYAQWREKAKEDMNVFERILDFFKRLFDSIRNMFAKIFG